MRMGRKIGTAKASLVAAFLAAGGAAATANANAGTASQPRVSSRPAHAGGSDPFTRYSKIEMSWGSALLRFLKLDGFPAYLKVTDFAQYYKLLSLEELSEFYVKDAAQVDGVLALYHKGGTRSGSLLEGILIGLEQYLKYDNKEPLLNFLKADDAQVAYLKFEEFFTALQRDAKDAFSFFQKETGITSLPAELG
jgi:hypothetical protein